MKFSKIIISFFQRIKHIGKLVLFYEVRKQKISIVTNNCIGGFIYKKYGCKFLSPTINLQMSPNDFVKFCQNLDLYLNEDITEEQNCDPAFFQALGGDCIDFPVGKLKDITIFFQHYKTFEESRKKWNERKTRLNFSNMYFILCDTYCSGKTICDEKTINSFFSIPYENKLFVTDNKAYKNAKNCFYIESNGDAWYKINPKTGEKYFFKYDYKKWFLLKR